MRGFHTFPLWLVVWGQVKPEEEDRCDTAVLTVKTSVYRERVWVCSFWLRFFTSLLKWKGRPLVRCWCLNGLDFMKSVLLHYELQFTCVPGPGSEKWVSSFRTQFLNLGTIDIWGQIIIWSGGTDLCVVGSLASSLVSIQPDASSTSSEVWQLTMSPNTVRCPLGRR